MRAQGQRTARAYNEIQGNSTIFRGRGVRSGGFAPHPQAESVSAYRSGNEPQCFHFFCNHRFYFFLNVMSLGAWPLRPPLDLSPLSPKTVIFWPIYYVPINVHRIDQPLSVANESLIPNRSNRFCFVIIAPVLSCLSICTARAPS